MRDDGVRRAEPADWPAIETLLFDAGLPLDGAREALDSSHVVDWEGTVAACAALEPFGDAWLLRSVAVRGELQGSGTGTRLVHYLLATIGSDPVVLVTTTAARWFQRFGFRSIASDAVPPSVTRSVEFRGACPSTATIMMKGAT